MYSEKTFKNYIFWIQVKRVFMILIFSSVGAGLGVLIWGILITLKYFIIKAINYFQVMKLRRNTENRQNKNPPGITSISICKIISVFYMP